MLHNWLQPVSTQLTPSSSDQNRSTWKDQLNIYTDDIPPLDQCQMAIIGLDPDAANQVRKQLYTLSYPFEQLSIADLGNFRKSDPSFIQPVVSELLESNILPVLIGRDSRQIQAQYQAQLSVQPMASMAIIDEILPFSAPTIPDDAAYLQPLLEEKASLPYHFCFLGYQSPFTDPAILDRLHRRFADLLSLGGIRSDITETEPYLRNADLLGLHLGALESSAAFGSTRLSPNGLRTEEICQLARYAGMSDKLRSFGIYGFVVEEDWREQTAALIAQIIWYFSDGVYRRTKDFPVSTDGLVEYIVEPKTLGHPIVFWKSKKSGRWWMQIPADKKDNQPARHRLIPCSYKDYVQASNGDLPDRLLLAYERFL
jgi:formiminoglutamase